MHGGTRAPAIDIRALVDGSLGAAPEGPTAVAPDPDPHTDTAADPLGVTTLLDRR